MQTNQIDNRAAAENGLREIVRPGRGMPDRAMSNLPQIDPLVMT